MFRRNDPWDRLYVQAELVTNAYSSNQSHKTRHVGSAALF